MISKSCCDVVPTATRRTGAGLPGVLLGRSDAVRKATAGPSPLLGISLGTCEHDQQSLQLQKLSFVLPNLYCYLQEEFISTVWDNNNLPPPSTTDATYNQPESLPTMQPQSSVAMHPDFGCAFHLALVFNLI